MPCYGWQPLLHNARSRVCGSHAHVIGGAVSWAGSATEWRQELQLQEQACFVERVGAAASNNFVAASARMVGSM